MNQENYFIKYLKYANLKGISLEQVFYRKYLLYDLDENPSLDIYKSKYLKYANSKGISLDQVFYKKYLMYKNKYLQLKEQIDQVGGAKPLKNILKGINLFADTDMEKYLNPFYGFIMAECGYIKNTYYLHHAGFINTPESQIVTQLVREIPGAIQPTKYIMQKIKPELIGKYIGFLYISKSDWLKDINTKLIELTRKVTSQSLSREERKPISADFKAINDLLKELKKLNKENVFYIKAGTDITEQFHILLYCLWWVSNDKNGIAKYYQGINEAFKLVNKYQSNAFKLISIPENFATEEFTKLEIDTELTEQSPFELLLVKKLNKISFEVFQQDYAKCFCGEEPNYADCGETTVRNFLNLIAYDTGTNSFDVNILKKLGATEPVIEYYSIFNTSKSQASTNTMSIFGENLNARDAWSKIIITHGSNVNWVKKCQINGDGYELNSKMALDGSRSNINQIVKNLLTKVQSIDKITTEYIEEINDETINGIGDIKIAHKVFGEIKIICEAGHYYMTLPKKVTTIKKLESLTEQQIKILNLFENLGLDVNNYIWYDIPGDYLPLKINGGSDKNLKIKFLELSLTKQYNQDVRRRIVVDVELSPKFLEIVSKSEFADQYFYSANNFNFVNQMKKFTQLNIGLTDKYLTSIDLTPLCFVQKIGQNFLTGFINLEHIDLTPLANVKKVGTGFLQDCKKLETIDLEKLLNITEIGEDFLSYCEKIKSVNFSSFCKVKYLEYSFLSYCKQIEEVDLSPMKELINIHINVLSNNKMLKKVNLNGLNKLKKISYNFLSNCSELVELNMQGLDSLETIDGGFIGNCKKLKQVDLRGCPKLKTIPPEYQFLKGTSSDFKIICTLDQRKTVFKNLSDSKITVM